MGLYPLSIITLFTPLLIMIIFYLILIMYTSAKHKEYSILRPLLVIPFILLDSIGAQYIIVFEKLLLKIAIFLIQCLD